MMNLVSVAAPKNCTLLAVFVVTIRGGPLARSFRSNMESFDAGCKELVCTYHARGEALLVNVAADGFEGGPVRLETVGPEIVAEHAPGLLHVIDEPGQMDTERIGVVQTVDRQLARSHECLV